MLRDRLAAGRRVLAPLTQVRILVPQPFRRVQGYATKVGTPFSCSRPSAILCLPKTPERVEMALSLSKGHHTRIYKFSFSLFDMAAWFYILRLQSGALYIGATKNLEQRYKKHCAGSAGKTTALDPPEAIVFKEEYELFSTARRREAQVKRWSRAKKEALVAGNKEKLRTLSKSRENKLVSSTHQV